MKKEEFFKKYNLEEINEEDGFVIDIVYATDRNFLKRRLYDSSICILRKETKEKLVNANNELKKYGYKIKIWDAYRSITTQKLMWECLPDERFVSNPDKQMCNHCKGSAVDITLCTLDGKEVEMPTVFDFFGEESFRSSYNKCSNEVQENVTLLEEIMIKYGFIPYKYEWWHFNDVDTYEIIKEDYR